PAGPRAGSRGAAGSRPASRSVSRRWVEPPIELAEVAIAALFEPADLLGLGLLNGPGDVEQADLRAGHEVGELADDVAVAGLHDLADELAGVGLLVAGPGGGAVEIEPLLAGDLHGPAQPL